MTALPRPKPARELTAEGREIVWGLRSLALLALARLEVQDIAGAERAFRDAVDLVEVSR